MKKFKTTIFYIAFTGVLSAAIYLILSRGHVLEQGRNVVEIANQKTDWEEFLSAMMHNVQHPLALLLLQIIAIILAARIVGGFFRKIGQPSVIGEMIAGILLGPSLLGYYAPEISGALFPLESLGNLQFLSQIGLILFMFVVGMELDLKVLKNKANDAVVISHASIVFPFSLGVGLAYYLYREFAPESIGFTPFALFIGIAMSITAFPVLARIVQERGIHKTRVGAVVITCAAADDITAWCLLAAVIAVVKAGSVTSGLYVIALAVIYVLLMLKVVKPFLNRVGSLRNSRQSLSKQTIAIFLIALILSSYATEVIGVHALFGAFMAGVIMPENMRFRSILIEKVEDVAVILLLPLFFVFTGLRTEIGLLADPKLLGLTGIIIGVAVAGKFLGSAVAAKFVGQNWRDSLTIGALMNTRGLMELVVLNIGYDLGVLSAEIFTMMVLMALVTTFMTGPFLDLINRFFKKPDAELSTVPEKGFRVLVAFKSAKDGKPLLGLASSFVNRDTPVTALHLSPSNELHAFNLEEEERRAFAPLVAEAERLDQPLISHFKASGDIDSDMIEIGNRGHFDLMLVGISHSIFEGSLLGRLLGYTTKFIDPDRLLDQLTGRENLFENSPFDARTRSVILRSKIPVGVFIDRGFSSVQRILLPNLGDNLQTVLPFAERLVNSAGVSVQVVNFGSRASVPPEFEEKFKNRYNMANSDQMPQHPAAGDLVLVSVEEWKEILDLPADWLRSMASTLIIKP